MTRRLSLLAAAVALLGAASSAFAHVVPGSGVPHAHDGDLLGLAVVAALMVAAAWLDRRIK